MFWDEVIINLKAGKGGDGLVSFRRERFIAKGGPDGGDGGDGGSIFLEADPSISTLADFGRIKNFKAEDGKRGGKKKMKGKKGKDLVLKVPLGTQVFEIKAHQEKFLTDLKTPNQRVLVAKGGKGGFGNAHFASPENRAPTIATLGEPGQEKKIKLVLKLLAEVGLIGLPNSGKSTLLSKISAARPKIAPYPFTTLIPNLGVVNYKGKTFTVADIPGLIEGASKGKGLGVRFLKHIERTKILVHLLDVSSKDLLKDFKTVNKELKEFSPKLALKPQIIVLNKIDLISSKDLKRKKEVFKNIDKVFEISALKNKGINKLLSEIIRHL